MKKNIKTSLSLRAISCKPETGHPPHPYALMGDISFPQSPGGLKLSPSLWLGEQHSFVASKLEQMCPSITYTEI